MSNRKNARVEKSRVLIETAMLQLLQTIPFDALSVSEICREATVSRNTFYRLYTDKTDVLKNIMYQEVCNFLQYFSAENKYPPILPHTADTIKTIIKSMISYCCMESKMFTILNRDNLWFLFSRACAEHNVYMEHAGFFRFEANQQIEIVSNKNSFWKYYQTMIFMASASVLAEWAHSGFSETPAEMADLIGEIYRTIGLLYQSDKQAQHGKRSSIT